MPGVIPAGHANEEALAPAMRLDCPDLTSTEELLRVRGEPKVEKIRASGSEHSPATFDCPARAGPPWSPLPSAITRDQLVE